MADNAAIASGARFIILGDMEEDRGEEFRPPPRLSFRRFNPAVEKFVANFKNRQRMQKNLLNIETVVDESLSKEEMTDRFCKISTKFNRSGLHQKKRKRDETHEEDEELKKHDARDSLIDEES
eukprot:TRINITY_DN43764_c0_g1_i2.p3 TRINITY_DN43764_c0_g1~~TRINITY_DN43764_c0_g1_i2.p3  ORF type:complete len:123 (+),score=40.82 TRINITY_DN43764_c0_g1_i2:302-670(+)